ncbi:MAG: flagellar export protein FliJ [Pseudomonadota bacterium]
MKRTDRLRRIVDLRRIEEETAARQLREARARRDHWQQIQDNLRSYGEHYRKRVSPTRKSAADLHRERRFVDRLDEAQAEQARVIEQVTGEVDLSEKAWRKHRAQLRATENLVDRLHQRDRERTRRREDREGDELASRMRRSGVNK